MPIPLNSEDDLQQLLRAPSKSKSKALPIFEDLTPAERDELLLELLVRAKLVANKKA